MLSHRLRGRLCLLLILASPDALLTLAQPSKFCRPALSGYGVGLHSLEMVHEGYARRFLIFVPRKYDAGTRSPLWVLAPGSYDSSEKFLKMSGLVTLAEEQNFAFAAMEGKGHLLNVGLHSHASADLPDDVEYTRDILRDVTSKLCIDMDRIRCTGFSRGARFCLRLASELSSYIASVASVSGLRFPSPNNATRPVPIVAFHGSMDPITPYWGNGDPRYWHASVPTSMQKWAEFNGCRKHEWGRENDKVAILKYTSCNHGADVVLVVIERGGHTWPNSMYEFSEDKFGFTSHEINANEMIFEFFMTHPKLPACHTVTEGDPCYSDVRSLAHSDLEAGPDEWVNLTLSSSLEDFQRALYLSVHANCPRPCPGTTMLPLAVEGSWATEGDATGEPSEVVILDGRIRWASGEITDLEMGPGGSIATLLQGANRTGRAAGGRIFWSNGDIWVRATGSGRAVFPWKDQPITRNSITEDLDSFEESLAPSWSRWWVILALLLAVPTGLLACVAAVSLVMIKKWQRRNVRLPIDSSIEQLLDLRSDQNSC